MERENRGRREEGRMGKGGGRERGRGRGKEGERQREGGREREKEREREEREPLTIDSDTQSKSRSSLHPDIKYTRRWYNGIVHVVHDLKVYDIIGFLNQFDGLL